MEKKSLPRRIVVHEVLDGRYSPGKRPLSWDARRSGVEKIKTTDGELISLYSDGGQSTPAAGWQLLLTRFHHSPVASDTGSIKWTLYGLATAESSASTHSSTF